VNGSVLQPNCADVPVRIYSLTHSSCCCFCCRCRCCFFRRRHKRRSLRAS